MHLARAPTLSTTMVAKKVSSRTVSEMPPASTLLMMRAKKTAHDKDAWSVNASRSSLPPAIVIANATTLWRGRRRAP